MAAIYAREKNGDNSILVGEGLKMQNGKKNQTVDCRNTQRHTLYGFQLSHSTFSEQVEIVCTLIYLIWILSFQYHKPIFIINNSRPNVCFFWQD